MYVFLYICMYGPKLSSKKVIRRFRRRVVERAWVRAKRLGNSGDDLGDRSMHTI